MEQGTGVEALPPCQELRHLVGGGSLQVPAEPGLEGDADPGPKHQREQELTGELSIADPGLALAIGLERADIDEHRPPIDELDVVRRGVLDRESRRKRSLEQVELEQGGIPQHREGPLVGVGDQIESWVPQCTGAAFRWIDLHRIDEPAVGHRLAEEIRRGKGAPPFEPSLVE